jgi:hypothetical protein
MKPIANDDSPAVRIICASCGFPRRTRAEARVPSLGQWRGDGQSFTPLSAGGKHWIGAPLFCVNRWERTRHEGGSLFQFRLWTWGETTNRLRPRVEPSRSGLPEVRPAGPFSPCLHRGVRCGGGACPAADPLEASP